MLQFSLSRQGGLRWGLSALVCGAGGILLLGTVSATEIIEADRKDAIVTADGAPAGGTHTTSPGVPQFGVDHDGAGELIITRGGLNYRCTGTLLSSGRHILTAAHCVANASGVNDTTAVTATFSLGGGNESDSSGTVYVHPSYDGDTGHGYDVAIVEFAKEWVASVPRYDLVQEGFDAIGLQGVSVGYGRTGYGDTGATYPSGTKRIGLNLWEAGGLGDLGVGGISNNDTQLTADFDNGLAANDGFDYFFGMSDLGLGADEVGLAQGDSGGPTFFNDGGEYRVGGVSSYVTTLTAGGGGTSDMTPGVADSAFGEFLVVANVGDAGVNNWILSTAGIAPVPEPSSGVLLLFGCILLGRHRRGA